MENLINLIKPELLVVSLILYGVGMLIKRSKIKDNFIPIILGAIGIVICITYLGMVDGFTVDVVCSGIIQGVLVAAASNYVSQVIIQMKKLGVNKEVTDVVDAVINDKKE